VHARDDASAAAAVEAVLAAYELGRSGVADDGQERGILLDVIT
jgi:hypothetical protein